MNEDNVCKSKIGNCCFISYKSCLKWGFCRHFSKMVALNLARRPIFCDYWQSVTILHSKPNAKHPTVTNEQMSKLITHKNPSIFQSTVQNSNGEQFLGLQSNSSSSYVWRKIPKFRESKNVWIDEANSIRMWWMQVLFEWEYTRNFPTMCPI